VVEEHAALLGPRLLEPGTGKLMFSFHSFVVRTGRHTILIDACIGNDKERPTRPQFHRMRTSFIDDLARLGVKPEDVDYVMCTHLHWDHVGWNTRLVDGSWVPTFPNAKYVMAKREYDHWQDFTPAAWTRRMRGLRRQHPAGRQDQAGAAGRRRLRAR
jgi:glyoxylase-like metal-dependent hydrolase (beta-lactamase superfamily II)